MTRVVHSLLLGDDVIERSRPLRLARPRWTEEDQTLGSVSVVELSLDPMFHLRSYVREVYALRHKLRFSLREVLIPVFEYAIVVDRVIVRRKRTRPLHELVRRSRVDDMGPSFVLLL